MKITHNPHGSWQRPSLATDVSYEADVQRATAKSERIHRQHQERLAKAEAHLARAMESKRHQAKRNHIAELEALVNMRREELAAYERLMVAVPASARHRGTKSFRPVPPVP